MLPAHRVLVVEDEVLIGVELRQGLTRMGLLAEGPITSGRLALEAVRAGPPDLVLMDIHLGNGMDGIEAAQHIRTEFDIPIVFLTAYSDELTMQRATATAPFGYLLKPISDAQLRATIPTALHRHRVERDAAIARENVLHDVAMRDPVTQQWNRREIVQILERETARADRENRAIGVLMIDVDPFKTINDTHGHIVGDTVIREIARRIAAVLRPYDALGRYDEHMFLVVTSQGRSPHAARLAERLERVVAGATVATGNTSIAMSINVGICTRQCGAGCDPAALLEDARRSLHAIEIARQPASPLLNEKCRPSLLRRIQGEFTEMPALSLTVAQARRLWGVDEDECQIALDALVETRFLKRTREGIFLRRL
jgi:diguanylate cyclase (GGDEF)-like protein